LRVARRLVWPSLRRFARQVGWHVSASKRLLAAPDERAASLLYLRALAHAIVDAFEVYVALARVGRQRGEDQVTL
jgi:hypothetical protein